MHAQNIKLLTIYAKHDTFGAQCTYKLINSMHYSISACNIQYRDLNFALVYNRAFKTPKCIEFDGILRNRRKIAPHLHNMLLLKMELIKFNAPKPQR